ncbi:hypothetical protein DL765_001931 [Monosporascus sp. GIB2]|nr:hypothetical protein DL765_001931 [Monosporascus sp. GIB2]
MEAIATLSLVCNVMQVITFSGDLLGLCRRTFKDGTPEPGLQDSTARLHDLVSSLSTGISDFDTIRTCQQTDPLLQQQERGRLQELASELLRDTEKLQHLLHKATDTSTKRRAVRTAFKYRLHYKDQVSSLEKKIQHYHGLLNSEFLTRICSSNQAIVAKSEDAFSNLSQEIKAFIDRWSDGDRDMSRLISTEAQGIKAHITAQSAIVLDQMRTGSEADMAHRSAEHRETRDLFTSETSKIKEHLDSSRQVDVSRREIEEVEKRILSTLWFPEMNQRENNIMEASEDTVRWIFGEEISDSVTESQASTIDSEDEDPQSPDRESVSQTPESSPRRQAAPCQNIGIQVVTSDCQSFVSNTHAQTSTLKSRKQASDGYLSDSDSRSQNPENDPEDLNPRNHLGDVIGSAPELSHGFPEWLKSDLPTFWVLGKPGSGKTQYPGTPVGKEIRAKDETL